MVYWNRFCLYTLLCFLSPITKYDSPQKMCTYFTSEDVDKMSLVLDASKYYIDPKAPSDCLKLGPFNTIFMHTSESSGLYQNMEFSDPSPIKYDHIIVLNNVIPINFPPGSGGGIMKAVSLTVLKNNYLMSWDWLSYTKFRYIRIEACKFRSNQVVRLDNKIFSDYLLTLSLVRNIEQDPWEDLHYELAPNLRELLINLFEMPILTKKHSKKSFMKLKRLNLENNQIQSIQKGFFDDMPILEVVCLEGNLLETFSHTFMSVPERIYLDDNPLQGNDETCEFLRSAPFADFKLTYKICSDKSKSKNALMKV